MRVGKGKNHTNSLKPANSVQYPFINKRAKELEWVKSALCALLVWWEFQDCARSHFMGPLLLNSIFKTRECSVSFRTLLRNYFSHLWTEKQCSVFHTKTVLKEYLTYVICWYPRIILSEDWVLSVWRTLELLVWGYRSDQRPYIWLDRSWPHHLLQ